MKSYKILCAFLLCLPNIAQAQLVKAEDWSIGFQATYVWQRHLSFSTAYDGPHSLSSTQETGYTLTSTLFLGRKLWKGAEIFVNPEIIQSVDFSGLHGFGGFSNSENQKNGELNPSIYSARAFIRQTFNVGIPTKHTDSSPNQFSRPISKRRFVLTLGQMSLLDIFDNNVYAHDGRTQFMNWALLTHGAWDYAADARGYSWGLALEYYHNDWAFRLGHFAQPLYSNGVEIDFKLWKHFGENLEVEHSHVIFGRIGKVHLLGFMNYANMAAFREAMGCDLASVRRDQTKFGFGVSVEQTLTRDLGFFGRFSWNDGRTETYAFTEIDLSISAGLSLDGRRWWRPQDNIGLAFIQNELSQNHRDFLAAGGLGNFIGDGQLRYTPECILETYYLLHILKELWFSFGYQLHANPAYNADRGPVNIFSLRAHLEI